METNTYQEFTPEMIQLFRSLRKISHAAAIAAIKVFQQERLLQQKRMNLNSL